MLPDAPEPTTAIITVSFTTVKDGAPAPPKDTESAPVKNLPLIVTVSPIEPVTGEKEYISGSL